MAYSSLHHTVNVFRKYSLPSIPTYVVDVFGFRYSHLRRLLGTKLQIYALRDGTRFAARPFSHDRVVIDEIFIHKVYNPKHFDIQNGDTVVDLGAHIGVFTIFAVEKARDPDTHNDTLVYSYEPDPTNFAMLKINLRLNHSEKQVRTFRRAVADRKRVLPLYVNETGIASTTRASARRVSVQAVTLEEIFVENKFSEVDFLKVDVEGAEYDVLKASEESGHLGAIKNISIECHSVINTLRLKSLLQTNGFRVKIAHAGHPTLFYLYATRCDK